MSEIIVYTYQQHLDAIKNAFDKKFSKNNTVCEVCYYCKWCSGDVDYYTYNELFQHLFDAHQEHLVVTKDEEYLEEQYIGRNYHCKKCFHIVQDFKEAILHYATYF